MAKTQRKKKKKVPRKAPATVDPKVTSPPNIADTSTRVFLTFDEWRAPFVELYRQYANVSHCCDRVGISRTTYYDNLNARPDFAAEIAQGRVESIESLELYARKRALGQAGMPSDKVLIFLLQHLAPERYAPEKVADIRALQRMTQKTVDDLRTIDITNMTESERDQAITRLVRGET